MASLAWTPSAPAEAPPACSIGELTSYTDHESIDVRFQGGEHTVPVKLLHKAQVFMPLTARLRRLGLRTTTRPTGLSHKHPSHLALSHDQ